MTNITEYKLHEFKIPNQQDEENQIKKKTKITKNFDKIIYNLNSDGRLNYESLKPCKDITSALEADIAKNQNAPDDLALDSVQEILNKKIEEKA